MLVEHCMLHISKFQDRNLFPVALSGKFLCGTHTGMWCKSTRHHFLPQIRIPVQRQDSGLVFTNHNFVQSTRWRADYHAQFHAVWNRFLTRFFFLREQLLICWLSRVESRTRMLASLNIVISCMGIQQDRWVNRIKCMFYDNHYWFLEFRYSRSFSWSSLSIPVSYFFVSLPDILGFPRCRMAAGKAYARGYHFARMLSAGESWTKIFKTF